MNSYSKILSLLTKKEKIEGFYLLILVVIMTIIDTFSIASVMPFIAVISDPDLILTNKYLNQLHIFFNSPTQNTFIFYLGLFVMGILIFSNVLRIITISMQISYTYNKEFTISTRLLEIYLHRPYEWFLNQNTSNLSKKMLSETRIVTDTAILSFIQLASYTLACFFIILLLAVVDFLLALVVLGIPATIYSIIFYLVKIRLVRIGLTRTTADQDRFKIANESLSSIRELNVFSGKKLLLDNFKRVADIFAKSITKIDITAIVPKYFMEMIAFGGMIFLVLYLLYSRENSSEILPLTALYALAGYRLLPAAQMIYLSITKLQAVIPSVENLYKDIKLKKETDFFININKGKKINLKNISYKYPGSSKNALTNINLSITMGQNIGVVGKSGSGKSTLIDIILGLIRPSTGKLEVGSDFFKNKNKTLLNYDWLSMIGYVPQQIFLLDDDVSSNIAFAKEKEKTSIKKIHKAALIAGMHDIIQNDFPQKYKTLIGEKGIRLSGGQIQRIGIARALYNEPSILIFDEATSSLDNVTENNIMNQINYLDNTVTKIIIAHRLSTIQNCDQIYVIDNSKIISHGVFEDLLQNCSVFNELVLGKKQNGN